MKWTSKAPGVWESKDGAWQIKKEGTHSGRRGTRVNWRIFRWHRTEYRWMPSTVQGHHYTLAAAKAAVVAEAERVS